jgi:predicted DNA binding protein
MSTPTQDTTELIRLKLKIWHPQCWTLQVTDATDAGLLGLQVFDTNEGRVKGRFTAYADSTSEIDDLIAATRESPLTESVIELHEGFSIDRVFVPGNTTRELFVEYYPEDSIDTHLHGRGFIRESPVWMYDGHEHWSVVIHADRDEVQQKLDTIREEEGATIKINHITSSASDPSDQSPHRTNILSQRQREVFELARQEGYYDWPRGTSVESLADQLELSKSTLLEHLRKAEAKILTQMDRTL